MVASGITLCLCVMLACVYAKDIVRRDVYELDVEASVDLPETDANGIGKPEALEASADVTLAKPSPKKGKKRKSVEERAIDSHVKDLKKLRCKPHRAKVYTREIMKPDNEFHDWIIYPEVLSVKRCDPNCTYCPPIEFGHEKPGKIDFNSTCQPHQRREKKYTIRAVKPGEGKKYFKLPVEIHSKCICKPKNADT